MKKAANIHAVFKVSGEDAPAHHFGEEAAAIIGEVIAESRQAINEAIERVARRSGRAITLETIEEIEGEYDDD